MTFELKKDELFPEALSKDMDGLAQPGDAVSELWVFG